MRREESIFPGQMQERILCGSAEKIRMDFCWSARAAGRRLPPVSVESDGCRELLGAAARGGNPACPWLPAVVQEHDYTLTRRHGHDKGAEFYQDALRYAQSLWIAGKPAQAVLQLDKAWMAELADGHEVLCAYPPPYAPLAWILRRASAGGCGYLGNPVRHFQHLASRMSGPRAEIRAWRAWLCFHLAERVLPGAGYPRDGRQIAREGLWIPGIPRVLVAVAAAGWPGEARHAENLLRWDGNGELPPT